MTRLAGAVALALAASTAAWAQDQQLGARTKAMGGSYTAFEDDPVSIWLNPAGIATQPDQVAVVYQTYTAWPVDEERGPGNTIVFSVEPETVLVDPGFWPSYLGAVFQLGTDEDPLAIGVCIARPYHINYAMDEIVDPLSPTFQPDSNVEQSYLRFRVAAAKAFRLKPLDQPGWLPQVSLGLGADLAYEVWEFSGPSAQRRDTGTDIGSGVGALVTLYDDLDVFKVNLGIAFQADARFDFDIEPDILPAFNMPRQLNAGATLYVLEQQRLRITIDFQWIQWSEVAEDPVFPGFETFQDALNVSVGFELRMKLNDRITLFPRMGLRRYDAPWDDEDDLPATGTYQLVLDTEDEEFLVVTTGLGIAWTTESGRSQQIDLAADLGGDSFNFAVGFTHGF